MIVLATVIGMFLLGYSLGNLSPSYLFGRIIGKLDIRQHGSGNAGTTNVIRLLGWRVGVLVFVLDALKGFFAVWLGAALGAEVGAVAAALGVVLGHDFPIVLGFRGGKGIAASLGVFLFLFPVVSLTAILLFVAVVLITKWVSLGSLSLMSLMSLYAILSPQPAEWVFLVLCLTFFAFLRHSENLGRIRKGTENKLSLRKA